MSSNLDGGYFYKFNERYRPGEREIPQYSTSYSEVNRYTDVPNILSSSANILSSLAVQSYFSKDPNLCCQESSDEPLSKVISDAFTLLNDTEGEVFIGNTFQGTII